MTGSWALAASLSLLLLLAGLVFKNANLLVLASPYLVWALLPLWRSLPPTRFEAKRSLEPEFMEGGQFGRVMVSLTNRGADLEEVWVRDRLPEGIRIEGNPEYSGEFKGGQEKRIVYGVSAVRGIYEFPEIEVSVGDLLGFRRRQEMVSCSGTLRVLPAVERLEKIRISPRRTRVFSGMIRSRESGAGVEFFGTRAYSPGDPLRHLNWKAGARWDILITNQFEQERVADVGIILDARSIAEIRTDHASLFEHSVAAAASLADYFIRQGNRVGLLIYGHFIQWVFPGYGKGQRARILGTLAGAVLGEHAVFKEFRNLPIRLFPAESQVVLVSPLRSEDVHPLRFLRALGYRTLIVSPDPIAFEKQQIPECPVRELAERIARTERSATLAKLRRCGTQVIDWDVSAALGISIRKQMAGFRR
jgi:uncharacterized protein (DUF58 family)